MLFSSLPIARAWTCSFFLQAQRSNNKVKTVNAFFFSFYCSGLDKLLLLLSANNKVKTVYTFFASFFCLGLDTCIPSFCTPSVQTIMVKTVNAFLSLSFTWAWTHSFFFVQTQQSNNKVKVKTVNAFLFLSFTWACTHSFFSSIQTRTVKTVNSFFFPFFCFKDWKVCCLSLKIETQILNGQMQ